MQASKTTIYDLKTDADPISKTFILFGIVEDGQSIKNRLKLLGTTEACVVAGNISVWRPQLIEL
jgi:hypothetical protein